MVDAAEKGSVENCFAHFYVIADVAAVALLAQRELDLALAR
jgi:hypothetical protein